MSTTMKRFFLAIFVTASLSVAALPGASAQPTSSPQATPTAGRLHDAYKREFAFLEAEKRALQNRLAEQKKIAAERESAAKTEISALQNKVVRAAGEAERLEEFVLTAERETEVLKDSEGVIEDILTRADATLKKSGIVMPEADTSERAQLVAQLRFVFEKSPALLGKQGQVRIEAGDYFDSEGNKVKGEILHIGNIASYGLTEGAQGPLAPAGEDRLKLWQTEGGAAAAGQLAKGQAPNSVPMFLYETLDSGVTAKVDKSVLDIIRTGGLIAWVIVGLGGVALLMVLIRTLLLLRASRGGKRLLGPVLAHVEANEVAKGRELAQAANNPLGRVLGATLGSLDLPREQLEDVVAEAVLHEQPTLSRFGSSIMVMAAVSPLLGLLGTVTGMISTFDVITEFGTGNPKLLSGGISEALVTTELGLIVAIPALLLGHVLSGWSDGVRDRLDASALAAVNRSLGLKPPEPGDGDEVTPEDATVKPEKLAA